MLTLMIYDDYSDDDNNIVDDDDDDSTSLFISNSKGLDTVLLISLGLIEAVHLRIP